MRRNHDVGVGCAQAGASLRSFGGIELFEEALELFRGDWCAAIADPDYE
ncbi:MAG: hypothetical protein OXT73_07790 [Bacteroidota bacterium]|nr:hypothetical protein [Bacteroidota bacterium]